jgi:hypothetical protein
VVQVVGVDRGGVEPDRVDDPQVVHLVGGDVAGADGVEDSVRDRGCTVPIRMLVYLPLLTVASLAITRDGVPIFRKL